jgi:hypothetical protein
MSSSLRGGDPPQIAYLHGFHHALNVAVPLTGAIVALATIRNRTSHPSGPVTETVHKNAPRG